MDDSDASGRDRLFRRYVRLYNAKARQLGLKMFRGTTKPRRAIRLRDLLDPRRVRALVSFASSEEEEKFRADFYFSLYSDVRPLASLGFTKRRQASEWGRRGAAEQRKEGDGNRRSVIDAAHAILAVRRRKPSARQLAKLIEEKTGIPANTVRGHLQKLKKERILD
ncbi:MAG: hypothetical protein JNM54_00365 [Candidatus Accumulibacter sp.]|uniref:hypothetical protein n=1 Tax=unclassified Candidatus Accumulibacter TaxID=2619054 RepID=UPI001A5D7418|nr:MULTISPECIES: hypothetical protein [unclassified Candidatus Accumulibacter]MBL8366361.1 hypothetical protein [Accumulibacter sp.]